VNAISIIFQAVGTSSSCIFAFREKKKKKEKKRKENRKTFHSVSHQIFQKEIETVMDNLKAQDKIKRYLPSRIMKELSISKKQY